MESNKPSHEAITYFAAMDAERAARSAARPQLLADGEAALRRLYEVACGDTGQSGVVARFLLGLYNGSDHKFDLTDLRRLDYALHDDCLLVLRLDHSPVKEVHKYFDKGSERFHDLAANWGELS